MTRTTKYLLLMLLTILIGTFFYITCCSECGATETAEPQKEAVIPSAPKPTSYPFAFSDGDYAYSENDNYNFNASSSDILMPLASSMGASITDLKTFLSENVGKVINVTGYYKSDETNNTAYPNLGLARANAVKNHLVENGISSASINTMGKLMDDMVPDNGIYLGPIAYAVSGESETAGDDIKALYDKIKADPLVLYFDTAQASISLSAEQRQKVADISRYLDKVDGAAVNIIGHTDNTGVAATNMRLGQNRADFAKAYLMRNGISEAKINTSSKGQTDPIESNATEEGRSKNRRTVVTLN
ncbi:OmpA family protein [Maribacter chungangensis]|uniref:OmpA family protein n=1 Tax=Maribacter chungangensis TaxID=1069117 RepID=A0ABW3B7D6_9FLAO